MTSNGTFEWAGPTASGLSGAQARLEGAAATIRAAAPRQWRSTSATAYADRLGEVGAACEGAVDRLGAAVATVRAYEAELATARAGVGGPFGATAASGTWRGAWP